MAVVSRGLSKGIKQMKQEQIVRKNLDLLKEFMKYAFEHEDILEKIGKGKELIILPENDDELLKANQRILDDCRKKGRPYVAFRMRIPERVVPHWIETA